MNKNQQAFKAALVAAFTEVFANDKDYAEIAENNTPEQYAKGILDSLLSKWMRTGKGVRMACRLVGIAYDAETIYQFLGR